MLTIINNYTSFLTLNDDVLPRRGPTSSELQQQLTEVKDAIKTLEKQYRNAARRENLLLQQMKSGMSTANTETYLRKQFGEPTEEVDLQNGKEGQLFYLSSFTY